MAACQGLPLPWRNIELQLLFTSQPPSTPRPCSVRAADCAALKVWQAHETAVLSIVQAGSRVYSLAADGSIKGWSSAVPHPADLQAL